MAAHGITGPRTIIDGDRGILQCFAGEFDAARVTQELGRDYLLVETAYKPITSPWPAHAPIEAFGWLIDQHHLVPDQIAAIEVGKLAFDGRRLERVAFEFVRRNETNETYISCLSEEEAEFADIEKRSRELGARLTRDGN
jgi:hypothetical protein